MTALINNDFNKLYNLPENTVFKFDELWRECLERLLDVSFHKFSSTDLKDGQHVEGGYAVGFEYVWGCAEYSSMDDQGSLYPTLEQALCALFIRHTEDELFHDVVKDVYGETR